MGTIVRHSLSFLYHAHGEGTMVGGRAKLHGGCQFFYFFIFAFSPFVYVFCSACLTPDLKPWCSKFLAAHEID